MKNKKRNLIMNLLRKRTIKESARYDEKSIIFPDCFDPDGRDLCLRHSGNVCAESGSGERDPIMGMADIKQDSLRIRIIMIRIMIWQSRSAGKRAAT